MITDLIMCLSSAEQIFIFANFQVQLKMAAELSKRSDDDRRRKLQLQEEADLAYAIALSKAEAASLKTQ